MSASCVVIVNGKTAGESEVEAALERLATLESAEVRVTEQDGDAFRFAREAARASVDRVIAFGGDGTLNAVVSGLVAYGGPGPFSGALGIVPTGTGRGDGG